MKVGLGIKDAPKWEVGTEREASGFDACVLRESAGQGMEKMYPVLKKADY
jgi:hypothetical protein